VSLCVEGAAAVMADSAERNGDGEVSVQPEGNSSTGGSRSFALCSFFSLFSVLGCVLFDAV